MSRTAPARRPTRTGAARRRPPPRRPWVAYAAGAIVLILVVFVAARLLMGSNNNQSNQPDAPVSPEVFTALTTVPADALNQVGRGKATQLPIPIHGTPQTSANGLPVVTYIGAEWCPYCAAERWSMIVALSRFGTFQNLSTSSSSSNDVYPSTPTFTFHGSSFTSQYVEFDPVELQSNVPTGPNSFQQLATPTAAQQAQISQYDAPPYVPSQSAGAIPFIDFANQYMVSGASYDVGVLQGQTREQIATNLSNPTTPQAQAILGGANALTAAICATTGGQPGDVCTQPGVAAVAPQLNGGQ